MTTATQFIYDQNGKKAFAVIPIADFENAFGATQPDAETQHWLEADMGEELPDWNGELPIGQPIEYRIGEGFIVLGGKDGR